MSQLKTHFYDPEAKRCFEILIKEAEESGLQSIDRELLITFSNLRSQKILLEKQVKKEGYTVVNVNSRGGQVAQVHPAYRAYMACVAELTKIASRLKKYVPIKDEDLDEFDKF